MKVSSFLVLSAFQTPRNRIATPISFSSRADSEYSLYAKPKRLEENVDGLLYVNDRCINCSACEYFAPETFTRSKLTQHHVVYKQPDNPLSDDFQKARAALAACPVSAIRTMSKGENHGLVELTPKEIETSKAYAINPKVNGIPLPFPLRLSENVWMIGHHSQKSFGAIPYLVRGEHTIDGEKREISIMVDVPKFSKSAIAAVKKVLGNNHGPDYLFLTHVDDTAQHNDWKNEFPSIRRIFHAGDLGENNWIGDDSLNDVEILLKENSQASKGLFKVFSIDGRSSDSINTNDINIENKLENLFQEWGTDLLIFHTPGHSPGSISLFHRNLVGTIFTGDTYSFTTRDGGHMTGFPRYGNNLEEQSDTLQLFRKMSNLLDYVAPGHGHVRNYIEFAKTNDLSTEQLLNLKQQDLDDALGDLKRIT